MEAQKKRKVVIPKENAVFWMDENGCWNNEHGKFEHPRIIKYFNSSIRKDEQGFYVYQATDEFEEKVYFPYKDTALFAVDLDLSKNWQLLLNTGRKTILDPDALFSKNDCLYMKDGEDIIKFTSKVMLKLAGHIKEQDDTLYLCQGENLYRIE